MKHNIILSICLTLLLAACGEEAATTPADPDAPVLGSIGNKSVLVGNNLNFIVTATDPNSETLTFTKDGTVGVGNPFVASPAATYNNSDQQFFNWDPANVGTYTVRFTVTNTSGLTDSEDVTISVSIASGGGSTGQSLFNTNCYNCHNWDGTASSFAIGPSTLEDISNAISRGDGGMGSLSNLTTNELQAISDYLIAERSSLIAQP